jgi:integrase
MPKNKTNRRRKRNGEGCIFQRSDGRWAAVLSIEGKRKTFYGATEQEVQDKLVRGRNQQLEHIPFTDERLTVRHWLETWLENIRPPVIRPKSWVTYENHVRLHLIPRLGHIRLRKLQAQDVRDFMNERLEAGYSASAVRDFRAALRSALNQAMNDGLLNRNVAKLAKPPEVEPKTPDPYTLEEARQLLEAARGHRLEALFVAGIGLGLRNGECRGLQWTDIDFTQGLLTVRHNLLRVKRVRRGDTIKNGESKSELLLGRPKSKKKIDPPLHLPRVVLEVLQRHQVKQAEERLLCGTKWRGDGNYVFTTHFGTPLEHAAQEFYQLCDRAGLRRIRFHDLRHSAAALLIAKGIHPKALQELLRHSSIQMTYDLYGHLFDQVRRETADKMDLILGGDNSQLLSETVVNSPKALPN